MTNFVNWRVKMSNIGVAMKTRLLLIMLVSLLLSWQCARSPYPENVRQALEKAGKNRAELEKVLKHYNQPQDSLKLKAAYYLIGNMPGHGYMVYVLKDTAGKEVKFNVLNYPDYTTMVAAWDSIAAIRGKLDYKKKEFIEDVQAVKADFLIKNIDLAFKAWREKPWAQFLTFDQFCRYVLPYRGSNEPLEDWRSYFYKKYHWLDSAYAGSKDVTKIATVINEDLKSWFKFDSRFYRHPTDQGLSEMLKNKMGRCEDMANLAIFAMRANGLAVTSDYTPYWADAANNHAWNALIDTSGKAIPFMGSLFDPGKYHLPNRIAKVYRKTYEYHKENLIFKVGNKRKIPRWLSGKSYIDVTKEYVPTADVTIRLTAPRPDTIHYTYLSVFNTGEWKAIQWGEIQGTNVTFKAMGKDLAYLPSYYMAQEIKPAAPAFILQKDGTVKELKPDTVHTQTLALISTMKRVTTQATDSKKKSFLDKGATYELFYWNDGWKSLGKKTAPKQGALVFTNAPTNALFWLVKEGSKKYERIFIYENGHQVWF